MPNIVKGHLLVAEVEHIRLIQEVAGSNPAWCSLSSKECVL